MESLQKDSGREVRGGNLPSGRTGPIRVDPNQPVKTKERKSVSDRNEIGAMEKGEESEKEREGAPGKTLKEKSILHGRKCSFKRSEF